MLTSLATPPARRATPGLIFPRPLPARQPFVPIGVDAETLLIAARSTAPPPPRLVSSLARASAHAVGRRIASRCAGTHRATRFMPRSPTISRRGTGLQATPGPVHAGAGRSHARRRPPRLLDDMTKPKLVLAADRFKILLSKAVRPDSCFGR